MRFFLIISFLGVFALNAQDEDVDFNSDTDFEAQEPADIAEPDEVADIADADTDDSLGSTRTITVVPAEKQTDEGTDKQAEKDAPLTSESKGTRIFRDEYSEPLFDAGEPGFFGRLFGFSHPAYKPVESEEGYRFYFLVGPYKPSNLSSSDYTFAEFFGNRSRPMFDIAVELQLLETVGTTGIKFDTGFYIARAYALFEGSTVRARDNITLYTFPILATGVHTFRFMSDQILVPYVEIGAGYFAFIQTGDGSSKGGRFNMVYGGGLKILLDWIDFHGAWKLDNTHGINNSYLVISYRRIQDLSGRDTMDFTSSLLMGGFALDI